jgi:hypothetical protein
MPELKFSPIPWTVDVGVFISIRSNDGKRIATMTRGFPKEEIMANANVLAASTDLLEVLEEILKTIPTDGSWWCPHCGQTDCSYYFRCTQCGTRIDECQPDDATIAKARAAVAKAKGHSNV